MKRITIAWTLILIIIIIGLTLFGFHLKKNELSSLMEKDLVKQTEKYLGLYTNLYPSFGQSKTITLDELIDNGYDPKLDDGCTGYVVIENTNMGFKYKPVVECQN